MSEHLTACAKYNDWKGSIAADDSDQESINSWIRENYNVKDDEYIVGLEFFAGESHGEHLDPINVQILLLTLENNETIQDVLDRISGPIQLRAIEKEINLLDFYSLFKRFSISMSKTVGMLDIEYEAYE